MARDWEQEFRQFRDQTTLKFADLLFYVKRARDDNLMLSELEDEIVNCIDNSRNSWDCEDVYGSHE